MQATAPTTIEREVRIQASPETVYSYFIDPAKMTQWMAMRAESDPKVGGRLRWDMNGFDIARGEYLELVPFSRIVFTWGWESLADSIRPGASRIEVTLRPDGDATVLKLVHSGLDEAAAQAHGDGWSYFMPRLAEAAATGRPAEPPEPLNESVALASQLNTLLCELRDVLEDTTDPSLAARTSGSGWTAAVTAGHVITHLALAQLAVDTAHGIRSPLVDFTSEQLAENNASLASAVAQPRESLLARLKSDGPTSVESIKSLEPASLENGQSMAFAGGMRLSARDLIQGPLLGDIRWHLDDIKAALA